jgi:hypothetical protein
VAEHPAAAATATAAAQLVPAGEESAVAPVFAEWATAGMVFIVVITARDFVETGMMPVVMLVHGMEEEMVQAHGRFPM